MRLGPILPLLACAAACVGRPGSHAEIAPTTASGETAGDILARVDGTPIHAGDVAAEIGRGGSSARAALDRLIDFELLAEAAARSISPATDDDVAEARDQAAV